MLCCIVIGACAVQLLHYAVLYRNIQHYATLNCRIKTRKCAGVTQNCIRDTERSNDFDSFEMVPSRCLKKYIFNANCYKQLIMSNFLYNGIIIVIKNYPLKLLIVIT